MIEHKLAPRLREDENRQLHGPTYFGSSKECLPQSDMCLLIKCFAMVMFVQGMLSMVAYPLHIKPLMSRRVVHGCILVGYQTPRVVLLYHVLLQL